MITLPASDVFLHCARVVDDSVHDVQRSNHFPHVFMIFVHTSDVFLHLTRVFMILLMISCLYQFSTLLMILLMALSMLSVHDSVHDSVPRSCL